MSRRKLRRFPLEILRCGRNLDVRGRVKGTQQMRYVIIIESTATGFSAFVPDLPGCITTGRDHAEVKREMKAAIRLHIDGMIEDGLTVPQRPTSRNMSMHGGGDLALGTNTSK